MTVAGPLLRSIPQSTPPHTSLYCHIWRLGEIAGYTTVPDARAALFREKFRDRDQVTAEAGKYYALYHHDPSWKDLSLISMQQEKQRLWGLPNLTYRL
ncbi:hypothetical protein GBAR_LOCUS25273 [Geodia barretti]|uniref:Uncharacterized protein n=1 Tax=Geodia barretti TaxID=519541 RepID=A0AA35TDX9_GEOBA|nr:hypothetical protein GBAR_LOCUS25273 [Geodia barretti]